MESGVNFACVCANATVGEVRVVGVAGRGSLRLVWIRIAGLWGRFWCRLGMGGCLLRLGGDGLRGLLTGGFGFGGLLCGGFLRQDGLDTFEESGFLLRFLRFGGRLVALLLGFEAFAIVLGGLIELSSGLGLA